MSVQRVNGPLVEADGATGVAMAEMVEIGPARLPAEVVAVRPDRMVLQAYEYTGGVRPGDLIHPLGHPLAAPLGPGLLGGVFDGLLRPLDRAATWLEPGATRVPDGRDWEFVPATVDGQSVHPGDLLGTVETGPVRHRVLVPPGLTGRASVRPAGRYTAAEPVARVGDVDVPLRSWWPVRRPRPWRARQEGSAPLLTGQRVLDAVFPVVKGGSAAVPGGFGTGKTVVLQQIAKWSDADVIVYVGCGERGNELADVVAELGQLSDPRTGGRLADRTVIVANTSNMPIMAREASVYTGVTVAEYYRDMGYDAVVIADSTSRWAEALREFASRTGALPAEEGYPAHLASALAAFYERAGRVVTLGGQDGSVTVVGAVSPPGGDMTEPVTAHTQRFVRSLWTLDRDLAYGRHYPAVAWTGSYCRDIDAIGAWYTESGDPGWLRRRTRIVAQLSEAARLAALAEIVGAGALPGHERIALLAGRLIRESVLQQSALSVNDAYCTPEKSAALIDAVLSTVERCDELVAAGVPVDAVEGVDFSPLVRAREEVAPDGASAVQDHLDLVRKRLEEVAGK